MKTFLPLVCGVLWLLASASASAAELYNLDFTSPEVGTYQTIFGSPTVQSSVGPFTDALVFHAVSSYDQIRLPINTAGSRYDIHYDVYVHSLLNSNYDFGLYLDTPEIRTVDFNGLSNQLSVFQPGGGASLGNFLNDTVYHFDIAINLTANTWSVAVNGLTRYSSAFAATSLQSLRFSMAPAVGGTGNVPATYAAIDNVVVNVVPEPGSGTVLALAAGLAGWVWKHRRASA